MTDARTAITPTHCSGALRIGVRVNARTSGGGMVFIRELIRALDQHSPRVRITLFVAGQMPPDDWPDGVELVSLGRHAGTTRGRLFRTWAMRSALARHPVDVLLCPGTEVVSDRRTPTMIWPLTVAPFEPETLRLLGDSARQRARWLLLRSMIKRAFHSAQAAVYSSDYARELHQRSIRRAADLPYRVIYPAPSLPATGVAGDMATAAANSSTSGPLLFVSHLYPYKMVVEMIEAYAIAANTRTDIPELVIAGRATNRNYEQRIRAVVQHHGLESQIRLLGDVEPVDLQQLYRSARAFVFPSLSENAGSYALIDAFAHGLPVLSSNTSSMPEICGQSALLFDPRRPDQLAQRISQLLDSPELQRRLRQLSHERIEWFPDWNAIAAELLDFAREIADVSTQIVTNRDQNR